MARFFKYKEHVFRDIDEGFSPEDVRRALVSHFPRLATAEIREKTLDNGDLEVSFVETVGRKG